MNIKYIKSNQKRKIVSQLEEQYGITDLPYLLIESGKEKIRGFSGHLSKEEINEIREIANIETLGAYLIRKEHDLRLSFDATQILKNQITKNIIEITPEDFQKWIRGYDLEIKKPSGTYVIKCGEDFIGCGKSNSKIIINHVPKDRRIKKPLPNKTL